MKNASENKTVSPFRAGLLCVCPRCGVGKLYTGFLTFKDKCPNCELDYGIFDAGDGPAPFIVMFLGLLIVGLALIVEVKFQPPFWLHFLLWFPSIVGGSLLLMRPAKALMVALQYHFKAEEGKLDQ
ncbi:hypothetical protein MNBD_ALPHA03-1404 [hydrothermal vent metagenome]|uniref:DUF983 domain-containing protein n=1 Tax=hydrothermal vent metagenome TaxID=652676 RepID=A0A3B1AV06_9ZZZZ